MEENKVKCELEAVVDIKVWGIPKSLDDRLFMTEVNCSSNFIKTIKTTLSRSRQVLFIIRTGLDWKLYRWFLVIFKEENEKEIRKCFTITDMRIQLRVNAPK